MQPIRWGALVVLALVGWLALPASPAHAEEKPIQVPLSYIVNLSNTGSPTAIGTAEVWLTYAEVRFTAQGLLPLPAGSTYALWLVDPHAGHFIPIGRFNVSSTGTTMMDVSLAGSIAPNYTMVLVTVQPDPEPHHNVPSNKYVIEGFFPGNSAMQHQVKYLPDTGQYAQHPPFETTITPDDPAPAATSKNPWLPMAPLGLALLSFGFVFRRAAQKRRR